MQREQQQALEQLRLKQQQQQEVEEQGRYQLAREAAPAIDIPGEQVKEIPTDVLKVKYREWNLKRFRAQIPKFRIRNFDLFCYFIYNV